MALEQERIARVEGILEEVRTRLNNLENRVQTQLYWILGVQITTWITVMLAVMLKD